MAAVAAAFAAAAVAALVAALLLGSSLGLCELKFQFWLNSVKFEQSYLAFSFARQLLQGRVAGWLGGRVAG